MDIGEPFRPEDISKNDLFDFVVNSSDSTSDNALPQFSRSLKSFGIYLESPAMNNSVIETNNNNNNSIENDNSNNNNNNNNISDNNNNSSNNEDCDKLINIDNRKERNNNNLLIANGTIQYMDSSTSYWSTTTVASCKDDPVVRWENSMLEDLNCWSHDNTGSNSSTTKQLVCDPGGSLENNTDGAIYTLTVLNGSDQSSTWYRLPETSTIHHENDDASTNQNHHHHSTTIPHGTTSVTPSIDFDSLLNNIIPSSIHQQTSPSSFTTFCPVSSQDIPARVNPEANASNPNSSNNTTNEPTSPIKSEYLYEDSSFQDNKNCGQSRIAFSSTSTSENHTNSNPEWKSTTESTSASSTDSRVNSLLRSALQGKSNSFSSRYNGAHTHQTHIHAHPVVVSGKTDKTIDGSSTTTVTISTCKEVSTATATSGTSGYAEIDENIKTHSPLMAVSLEGGTVVMFDGGSGSGSMIVDSDNPSSAQSMDDIFLSHLDTVTYAEDYEKLKSIENEVAKSVEQYCTNPYLSSTTGHITTNDPTRIPSITHHLDHTILSAIPSTTSSPSKNSKKYGKRSSNSNKTGNGPNHHQLHQTQGNASSSNSAAAGGIRKERSLHYCTICHKGFKDKYSVNVHVRTHTGEKPFTCTFCGKNFRQKAHLAKHHHTHSVQKNAASNVGGNSTKPQNNKHR